MEVKTEEQKVDPVQTEVPAEPQEEVTPATPEVPQEEQVPTHEQEAALHPAPEDRSAFNCKPCAGEGLIGNPAGIHKVCEACNGTGKI